MIVARGAPVVRAVLIALVLVVVVGCGESNGDTPSHDALAKGLESPDSILGTPIAPQITDCVASELLDAGLSNGVLHALAEGDRDFEPSKSELESMNKVLEGALSDCMDELNRSE